MRSGYLKFISSMLVILIIVTACGFSVCADTFASDSISNFTLNDSQYKNYSDYCKETDYEYYCGEDIIINDSTVSFSKQSDVENISNNGQVKWNFTIADTAFYNFYILFRPTKNEGNVRLEIKIDDEIPFAGMETVELTSDWIDAGEPRKDVNGNEISPEQVKSEGYYERLLTDRTGVVTEPYLFALSEGEHSVTISSNGYSFEIKEFGLTAPEKREKYSDILKNYDFNKSTAEKIINIHAEDAVVKTDSTLIPMSTSGDSGMVPVDPYCKVINYIGGVNWNTTGQKITWKFTAEESGYYKFGTRYKQNELINGESVRWLQIDGETPFEEAGELKFMFGTDWQHYVFASEEEYYFWLDAGEHTISLETTMGELSKSYDRLNSVLSELGDLYLQIVMVTGETPDINRDYELFKQIPDFNDVLNNANAEFELLVKEMQKVSGKRGSQYTAAIDNMRMVIDKMINAPYIAHIYVKDFYTNYTTLSAWLNDMKKMPLALDEIQLVPYGKDFEWDEPNFFESIIFSVKRFIASFSEDYKLENKNEKQLKLWVNWGRDQTLAFDSLIRDSFTAQKGIKVELQIVSNSLINGLLSGNFPDLQMGLSRKDPVDYGIRGALTDLTEFDDYEEILTRFADGADIPYWNNGALYALPEQQTFYCMFYRTDVFEQLGLSVPNTWDEFMECATTIQRYNMAVYVPYTQITSTTTVNSGIGSLHLYPTLMMQSGCDLYNDELNKSSITDVTSINVFSDWVKMYTDYGYLKEADFYNRFRNGSMPLGIASYTTYMTFYSTAPEISNRWKITNVPGTVDGNNYIAGGGTGCGIVKESKLQKEAWEFLKWWTSAETQTRYSSNVETILGMLGRVPTANVEAFNNLEWDPKDLEALNKQWACVREIPEVPGGYYLTRAVDQAFWSVINDSSNPKDAIVKWAKVADAEIERKIKEYS